MTRGEVIIIVILAVLILLWLTSCATIKSRSKRFEAVPNSVTLRLIARYAMAIGHQAAAKSLLNKALETAEQYNQSDVNMCQSDLKYWQGNHL